MNSLKGIEKQSLAPLAHTPLTDFYISFSSLHNQSSMFPSALTPSAKTISSSQGPTVCWIEEMSLLSYSSNDTLLIASKSFSKSSYTALGSLPTERIFNKSALEQK